MRYLILLLICVWLTLLPVMSFAVEPVVLSDGLEEYPLGLHLEYLEDKEKKWTIKDLESPEISNRFIKSKKQMLSFLYSKSGYWIRFKMKNRSKIKDWILESDHIIVYKLDFYIPKSGGYLKETLTEKIHPKKRKLKNLSENKHYGLLLKEKLKIENLIL